jgi:DNA-cytosine methyltransferase
MNVLSLFDGMSCGQIALNKLGIKIDNYFACEIDKYAIKVTQDNFPNTIQLGDVTKVDFKSLPRIDLLIGGSPCQGFSFAGKQLNFNDPRSALFFEYVRALKETNPAYFLLENVLMKQEYQDIISDLLNVKPILINSSLVSAQNRKRLYWTNISKLNHPKDIGISLDSIIEKNKSSLEWFTDREKSHCLDANYFKGGNLKSYFEKHRRQLLFNYSSSGRGNGKIEGRFSKAIKSLTLTASGYSNRSVTGLLIDFEKLKWRKLTVLECKRLQTVPDDYRMDVSKTQSYKMLGNGWTIDVIVHILKGIKQ